MRLLLILLLLTSVALAEDWNWRELKVKGSLTCGHHGTADIWIFKASLVRQPKFIKIDKVEVVDSKVVNEFNSSFSLQSPEIGPFTRIGLYDYSLKIDSVHGCNALPKSIALDWEKRSIDLGLVNLRKI